MADDITNLSVEDAYDRWAALYDGADNPMVFGASRVMAAALADVAGRDVFEFGCGTGRNLALLKAAGARSVAGCDLSSGMLGQARRHDPALEVFQHDMMQPLPRAAASADLVLFCLALEHADDLVPPLREAKRLLRPGGEIMIIEIHPFVSQTGVAAHFVDAQGEVRMPTFAHRFTDYTEAFEEVGLYFSVIRQWRPSDLGPNVPARALKRGADHPLVLEWRLTPERPVGEVRS